MIDMDSDRLIRRAMVDWYFDVTALHGNLIEPRILETGYVDIQGSKQWFSHQGSGIWKPKFCRGALRLYSRKKSIYKDIKSPRQIEYSYAKPSNKAHNEALHYALHNGLIMLYVQEVQVYPKLYQINLVGPVRAISATAQSEYGSVMLSVLDEDLRLPQEAEAQPEMAVLSVADIEPAAHYPISQEQEYREVTRKQRMRQQQFAEQVKQAYVHGCAVCTLKPRPLLEAAHIRSFADGGPSTLPNGIALCNIHHRAFDQRILGITPDYIVKISEETLALKNGPMLKHGLQEMHGRNLSLPQNQNQHPSQDYLAEKFDHFLSQ